MHDDDGVLTTRQELHIGNLTAAPPLVADSRFLLRPAHAGGDSDGHSTLVCSPYVHRTYSDPGPYPNSWVAGCYAAENMPSDSDGEVR